jgi:hypothetical protein
MPVCLFRFRKRALTRAAPQGWPLALSDPLVSCSGPLYEFLEDPESPTGAEPVAGPSFSFSPLPGDGSPLSPRAEEARERAAAARARADAAAATAASAAQRAAAASAAAAARGAAPPPVSPPPRAPPHALSPPAAPGVRRAGRRTPRSADVAHSLALEGPSTSSRAFFSRPPPRPVLEKENLPAKGAASAAGGAAAASAGAGESAKRGAAVFIGAGRASATSKRAFGGDVAPSRTAGGPPGRAEAPPPPTEPPAKVPRRAAPPPQQPPPQQQGGQAQPVPQVNYSAHAEAAAAAEGAGGSRKVRRGCSACGANKTPQWRMGPTGAKTLCNACGVRYRKDVQTGAAPPPPDEAQEQEEGGADSSAQ